MESLRGPINSFLFGEIEMGYTYPQMPFLQILNGGAMQSEERKEVANEDDDDRKEQLGVIQIHQRYPLPESNLDLLIKIQNRFLQMKPTAKIDPSSQLDSCVTHASESQSETNPAAAAGPTAAMHPGPVNVGPLRDSKKKKRPRQPAAVRSEQAKESQRMNHIAVERNRRRLMNSHLSTLRSLMPPSFVPRGDQATVIGGAIDFVKVLEQLLLSLQAATKNRIRAGGDATSSSASSTSCTHVSSRPNDEEACHVACTDDLFVRPQYTGYSCAGPHAGVVDVEATLVQGHVSVKVLGRKRQGQVARAVAAMEGMGLSVLHLNITSIDAGCVFYSLNLKMEERCELNTADEIAMAVHEIFSCISNHCD